jgi:hypothetical protein
VCVDAGIKSRANKRVDEEQPNTDLLTSILPTSPKITVDNMFKVSLDSHALTIIEADFIAIIPQDVTWLFLGIGQ